jgi:hypothetical protein
VLINSETQFSSRGSAALNPNIESRFADTLVVNRNDELLVTKDLITDFVGGSGTGCRVTCPMMRFERSRSAAAAAGVAGEQF